MEELLTLAEKEIVEESVNAVRTIADSSIKTKAYYNALAANAVETYLRENGLISGEIYNLHASAKMLADFEIADIQLPNLHIDVRAVFDEEEIFIPKKHFYNNILPDIYLVLKLDEDLTRGVLLGYVEPSKINKQNQNDEYYFVNKSFLTPVSELRNLIITSAEKTQYMITEVTEGAIEKLIMLYMDHDLDNSKLQKLLDYLKNSAIAREKLVEFENFERLSYLALQEFKDLDLEKNDFTQYIKTLVTTDEFAQFEHNDDLSVLFNEDSGPAAGGLFIDDEQPSELEENAQVESENEQEVYEESEFLDENEEAEELLEETEENTGEDILPSCSDVQETVEKVESPEFDENQEAVESPEAVEDVSVQSDYTLENIEELQTEKETPVEEIDEPVDEFEAFDAVDEFDVEPEAVVEEEAVPVEASSAEVEPELTLEEDVVKEHELVLESDELSIEAGDVLDIELPENAGIITGEETADTPELPEKSLSGEDLEFQFDGLENITDENNLDEKVEPETLNFESESEPAVDVEEKITLEELPVEQEPVASEELSESIVEEEKSEDSEPVFDLEGLEFDTDDTTVEEVNTQDPVIVQEVESVSDEDVEKAIALSELDGIEQPNPVHEKVEEISNDEGSENGEFSLDELLSIENDLASPTSETTGSPAGFKFDEDEEEAASGTSVATETPSEEDLSFLSAELDENNTDDDVQNTDEQIENVDENVNVDAGQPQEEQAEDEGTDFAFAVDTKSSSKKLLAPIAALVAVIGLAGVGAWYFLFNGKSNNTDIALVDDINNTSVEDVSLGINDVTPAQAGDTTVADIQLSGETIPAKTDAQKTKDGVTPELPAGKTSEVKPEAGAGAPADLNPVPEPLTLQKIKKDFSQPNTYLSVSKIVWDVPEYLTYNDDFSGYLQTLGSTLKLNLSGDLLLVSENTLFDKIRVKVELKDSGSKFSAEISDGCGTKSVDDLVLQSVKNTLNLLKPPVNSLDTADESLYITIYL